MKEWTRHIWHPKYGNWGGAKNTHIINGYEPKPIDAMDALFKKHDVCLSRATTDRQRTMADNRLGRDLKKVKVKGVWANIYRLGAMIAFKPRGK